jgi:hypothetical protein
MQDYEKLGVFYLGREVDPASGEDSAAPLLYDSRDLTTHAVCVGMTGSGKTGLCISLLEEAALDGVPALVIDPKGDIGNLLLAFPDLAPADFEPWVDPGDAARKGITPAELAAKTAGTWRKGLAEWDQDGERVRRFREAADVAIYTPGSDRGLSLSVLKSLAPPAGDGTDPAALTERIAGVVSGLLGLLGIEADPLKSREHILLSSILAEAWEDGRALDLPGLIAAVQKPPFDKVGVFDVETFFPSRDRLGLAMAVNNLLASPGFDAWLAGDPLDVQRLLFTAEGKPRISIVSIAHLPDAERMFVVTLLLNELVAWMRTQSGTSSLRALLYMDEIFGFFPPTAQPPSKRPMLTLMKQARAFGVGVVLATQNPVDLDYKGLSNAGTWFIGRLQTERDQARVIDGLQGAAAGSAFDRAALERLMAGISQRVFLMRNVRDDEPVLFRTRWAMSYLRGPLTLAEIARLMTPRREAATAARAHAATALPAGTDADAASSPRPVVPAGVKELFLTARPGSGPLRYRPRLAASARLHYVDSKSSLDAWRELSLVAPFGEDGEPVWPEAAESAGLAGSSEPLAGAAFEDAPGPALREKSYAGWEKDLKAHLHHAGSVELLRCAELKLSSLPAEPEGDFRARIALALRERRDEQVDKLRDRYASKLHTLDGKLQRATERLEREQAQYTQRKVDTAVSIGTSVLGALFGGRRSAVGKAGTAAKSAGRVFNEKDDVERAEAGLAALRQERAALEAGMEAEVATLAASLDPHTVELERIEVPPRKTDIAVTALRLAWEPWRRGDDGAEVSAWDS